MRMDKSELLTKIRELLSPANLIAAVSIDAANFKPHPYVIGISHAVHASDQHGGILDESAILDAEKQGAHCEWEGGGRPCLVPYAEHTYDTALFIKLTRNLGNREAAAELMKIKPILEENKIAGIALLETPEKYRIAQPEVKRED